MTKPLQGSKYTAFDREIMGLMEEHAMDETERSNLRGQPDGWPLLKMRLNPQRYQSDLPDLLSLQIHSDMV